LVVERWRMVLPFEVEDEDDVKAVAALSLDESH
jgi:hypothetical protein